MRTTVRACIELRDNGDATAAEIADALGVSPKNAAGVLCNLAKQGCVVRVGKKRAGTTYAVIYRFLRIPIIGAWQPKIERHVEAVRERGLPAGRITIPQYRWGSSRLG